MNEHTPKHFVLQVGSLLTLYASIISFIVLLFGIINLSFPDASESYYSVDSHMSMVRFGIAMLIVFLPTYFYLVRKLANLRRSDKSNVYRNITKWLIYLSFLIAGGTLLIDLVVTIMAFLEGELTIRFILKSVVILLVVGASLFYYLKDVKNYWLTRERASILIGVVIALIALASIIYGATLIKSPSEVREGKLDETQISDLQHIQWQIEDYYYQNGTLPASLEILNNIPSAPEERPPYVYELTDNGFRLCADFKTDTTIDEKLERSFVNPKDVLIINGWDFEHSAGYYCFERTINRDFEL